MNTPTVIPYPGELYILNKLLDAIIDVNGESTVDEFQKLFMVSLSFPPGCVAFSQEKYPGILYTHMNHRRHVQIFLAVSTRDLMANCPAACLLSTTVPIHAYVLF